MDTPFFTITANRTSDGSVTYVDRAGTGWTGDVDQCFRTSVESEAERILAWAKTQESVACDPYLLPIGAEGERVTIRSARERIRAGGPEETLVRLGYGV